MQWRQKIAETLSAHFGCDVALHRVDPVGGGSINRTYRLSTSHGQFFAKVNSFSAYPDMFQKEARGLNMLLEADTIAVPKPLTIGAAGDQAFLLMPYIESAKQRDDFWPLFGQQLAQLHQRTHSTFGLDHDNYIGSLVQNNTPHERWCDFFIHQRLEPQLKMARDNGKADVSVSQAFSRLFYQLDDFFPAEPPALLHGDLWSGNYLAGQRGEPVVIDPAVYFGHREMDLGMTRLFGGFHPEFYHAYDLGYPLEKGWKKRVDICNLYPLMVHVNLFGGGYSSEVKSVLRGF